MSVRFKIGFTIDAETLFSIVAKFLPLEDLSVKEVGLGRTPAPRAPKQMELAAPVKKAQRRRTMNAQGGAGAVVLAALADGQPHAYRELQQAMTAAGFSGSGFGSLGVRLLKHRLIERAGMGVYRLARKSA